MSLNINKAKKELKWKPRLNLNQTINFTADWYKNYFEKKKHGKLYREANQYFFGKLKYV